MEESIETNKTIWLALGAALLLVAAPACKSDGDDGSKDDQAEAVETEKEKQETDKEGDGEQGTASKNEKKKASDSADKADGEVAVGKPAPDFTLTDASGNEHSLSDYKGKPVVLEWTNPECPYVQRHYEAGTMADTHDVLGREDVEWLVIDSSHHNKPEDSKAWKKKHDVEHPILQDTDGKVGRMYEAKTTPHMFVIDGEGVLRYQGAIDDDEADRKDDPTNYVNQAVEALQAGEDIDTKSTKPYGCSVKYEG